MRYFLLTLLFLCAPAYASSWVFFPSPSSGDTLPLDTASATFAVSTRLLRAGYTGDAIRVRRSSDNTESDIGFSGGELDTSALTAFVGANDGFVVAMYDQSGTTNKAYQAATSAQPKIVSSGTVITDINGKPCLEFDGSSDLLLVTNSGGAGQGLSNFVTASSATVFTASRVRTISTSTAAYGGDGVFAGANGGSSYFGVYYYATNKFTSYVWDGGSKEAQIVAATNTSYASESRLESGTLYHNATGVSEASVASGNIGNLSTTPQIGKGNQFLDGFIGEIIVYNSALSSGDRADINTDLTAYWTP